MYNKLCPGFSLNFQNDDVFNHYIGGINYFNGAQCYNCKKELILHMALNTNDQRLNLDNTSFQYIPFLYCMRCALSWYDFQYQIISISEIKILKYHIGETLEEEWQDEVGLNQFPQKNFTLKPIPNSVQKLYDKLNNAIILSESEKNVICSFTKNYASKRLGAYPIIDVSNQIGGRAFLSQCLNDPTCLSCSKKMYFIASLTNDLKNDIVFSFESVQIVFFYCPFCINIHVQHSI